MRMLGMLFGFYEDFCYKKLKEVIKIFKYSSSMKWEGDKLWIILIFFENFFVFVCVGIVDYVRDLLGKFKVIDIDIILMVGGFLELLIL